MDRRSLVQSDHALPTALGLIDDLPMLPLLLVALLIEDATIPPRVSHVGKRLIFFSGPPFVLAGLAMTTGPRYQSRPPRDDGVT